MPLDLNTIAAGMAWTAIPEFDSSVVDETAAPYLALKFLEPAQPATFVRCPCGDSHGATVERILTKDRRTVFLAFAKRRASRIRSSLRSFAAGASIWPPS